MEKNTESVEIPKLFLEIGGTQEFIKEAIAATLFYTGKITGKQVCETLDISRRQWEEDILPKFGYTTMRNIDDSETELRAATW